MAEIRKRVDLLRMTERKENKQMLERGKTQTEIDNEGYRSSKKPGCLFLKRVKSEIKRRIMKEVSG